MKVSEGLKLGVSGLAAAAVFAGLKPAVLKGAEYAGKSLAASRLGKGINALAEAGGWRMGLAVVGVIGVAMPVAYALVGAQTAAAYAAGVGTYELLGEVDLSLVDEAADALHEDWVRAQFVGVPFVAGQRLAKVGEWVAAKFAPTIVEGSVGEPVESAPESDAIFEVDSRVNAAAHLIEEYVEEYDKPVGASWPRSTFLRNVQLLQTGHVLLDVADATAGSFRQYYMTLEGSAYGTASRVAPVGAVVDAIVAYVENGSPEARAKLATVLDPIRFALQMRGVQGAPASKN